VKRPQRPEPTPTTSSRPTWLPREGTLTGKESEARRRDKLSAINRELGAMSDWELERGLASSLGFDHERRDVANSILRERYAGPERGIALWILTIAAGAGVIALLE
jgi:hypothetical protein